MGGGNSKIENRLEHLGSDERYYGIENFGNTCYINSVLQALYFTRPFRLQLQKYASLATQYRRQEMEEQRGTPAPRRRRGRTILRPSKIRIFHELSTFFDQTMNKRNRFGTNSPGSFVKALKGSRVEFDNYSQQDAQELLLFVFNRIHEEFRWLMKKVEEDKAIADAADAALGQTSGVNQTQTPPSTRRGGGLGVSSAKPEDMVENLHVGVEGGEAEEGVEEVDEEEEEEEGEFDEEEGEVATNENGDPVLSAEALARKQAREEEERKRREEDSFRSFVTEIFEGKMAGETRCLTCETVNAREEPFFMLSVPVDENLSLTKCLDNFTSVEILKGSNKYFCEHCRAYQEAQKSTRVHELPPVLVIHLKRFKLVPTARGGLAITKSNARVSFPFVIRLSGVCSEQSTKLTVEMKEARYELVAIVCHYGSSLNFGHYYSYVKTYDEWICMNDTRVSVVNERRVRHAFGHPRIAETAYILFYRKIEE